MNYFIIKKKMACDLHIFNEFTPPNCFSIEKALKANQKSDAVL